MGIMHEIRDWWALVIALIALGVWLVRLEAITKAALREVERLEKQLDADRSAAQATRTEQNEMLREMRADIKRLLERR